MDHRHLYAGHSSVTDIVTGDFNQDGVADVVLVNSMSDGPYAQVSIGNGDGTFRTSAAHGLVAGVDPWLVAIGDLNQDGRPDVVSSSSNSGDLAVLLATPDGGFAPRVHYQGNPGPVRIGDVTADGIADIVAGSLFVLRGIGDGTFQHHAQRRPDWNDQLKDLRLADVDQDGYLDIVTVHCNGTVATIISNADGTFQPAVRTEVGRKCLESLAVADFDRDGAADVLVSHQSGSLVMVGDGSGGFSNATPYELDGVAWAA